LLKESNEIGKEGTIAFMGVLIREKEKTNRMFNA
jgi:hypothetical protein